MKFEFLLASILITLIGFDPVRADPSLPRVEPGLRVELFARDPLVRNPCAITFDARGRLFVGMGPQYRRPRPETPGDGVFLIEDRDADGLAETRIEFATGFNSIQGLAFRGDELWIANAPDLTVVRDVDGDGVADEYVRLWTDLGNLEHGLHGLNWAPDGKLYLSKGNSKGLTRPPGRLAPRPFRELWDVDGPELPDAPPPRVFTRETYEKNYHDPADDWGRQGGILRCDPGGENLEIVAAGFRNPWDIAYDDAFNWLGTDNDQSQGDKLFTIFPGAHLGWGHAWSASWSGVDHLPTVPASGPLFEGSGTGVTFWNVEGFPEKYRGIFVVNDWLSREILVYRPAFRGSLLSPASLPLRRLASAGSGRTMARSDGRSFDPVDIEVGPDGALYVSSWGREYGARLENGEMHNEGRIYRIVPSGVKELPRAPAHWRVPVGERSLDSLLSDLESLLPAVRGLAREELLRRGGPRVEEALRRRMLEVSSSRRLQTWAAWTLGSLRPADPDLDAEFRKIAGGSTKDVPSRVQAIRILGHRRSFGGFERLLDDAHPRIRHEALVALKGARGQDRADRLVDLAEAVVSLLAREDDRLCFYSAWRVLEDLMSVEARKKLLEDARPAVRRGALLSLLERDALEEQEVKRQASDADPATAALARKWLSGRSEAVVKGPPLRPNREREPPAGSPSSRPPASFLREIVSVGGADALYESALLHRGARVYSDRGYRIRELPGELEGEVFIRTSNHDSDRAVRLHLKLSVPGEVLLAHDTRIGTKPSWLREYELTDESIVTDDARFQLFRREFEAGLVELGPNVEDGRRGGCSQYFVVLRPRLLEKVDSPTTIEAVERVLDRGSVERGRDLFLSKQGAGCVACHRLEGQGNVFAPDLGDLHRRAPPRYVIESILDPGAAITEGFTTQNITTRDGTIVSGLLVEETGQALILVGLDGRRVRVPRGQILARESSSASAMPVFSELLGPGDVADLVAYLMSIRAGEKAPEASRKSIEK